MASGGAAAGSRVSAAGAAPLSSEERAPYVGRFGGCETGKDVFHVMLKKVPSPGRV